VPSIGTYHRPDRLLNCLIRATKLWVSKPLKVLAFPLENSGMGMYNEACYIRIQQQASAAADSDVAGELAIFSVDFSPWSTRLPVPAPEPPCGFEALFRGRDPFGSSADQEDRARILASLVQLGLALRLPARRLHPLII
jgi:hypothetical protein